MYYILLILLIIVPGFASAETGSIQELLTGIGGFMNDVLTPLLLGVAFLFFVINAVRFFVIGGSSEEGQESAKNLALYSIGAFVFILSFWGIVNVLANGLGVEQDPCDSDKTSDYIISSLAPCTSPRPHSNAGSGTGNLTGTGDIIGGGGAGTGGGNDTSFDINGNSIAYQPVTAAQTAIRNKAAIYFASHDYQVLYGSNALIVKNMLFADFSAASQSTTVTETERVNAAYRLLRANAITQNEYNTYFNAVNTYFDTTHQPQNIISTPTITSITVSQPAVVNAGIASSKAAVKNAFEAYNTLNADTAINVTNSLADLYTTSIPTATRWANFKNLYDSVDSPIADTTDFQIFNTYRDNLNTENAFEGNFTPIW